MTGKNMEMRRDDLLVVKRRNRVSSSSPSPSCAAAQHTWGWLESSVMFVTLFVSMLQYMSLLSKPADTNVFVAGEYETALTKSACCSTQVQQVARREFGMQDQAQAGTVCYIAKHWHAHAHKRTRTNAQTHKRTNAQTHKRAKRLSGLTFVSGAMQTQRRQSHILREQSEDAVSRNPIFSHNAMSFTQLVCIS